MIDHEIAHIVRAAGTGPFGPEHIGLARALGTLWPRVQQYPGLADRWRTDAQSAAVALLHAGTVGTGSSDAWWSERARRNAIRALERLGGPVDPLLELVDDPDVAWRAVIAIGRIDPDAAREKLLRALDDPRLGFAAASALGQLRTPDQSILTALVTRLPDIGAGIAGGLVALCPRIPRPVISAAVMPYMRHDVALARRNALKVLIGIDDPQWPELCYAALSDPDVGLRHQALTGLGRLVHPDLTALQTVTSDPEPWTRAHLVEVLKRHPTLTGAMELLDELLDDEREFVRNIATRGLADMGGSAALQRLRARARVPGSVGWAAMYGLGMLDDVDTLGELLADSTFPRRGQAARLIAESVRRGRVDRRAVRAKYFEPIAARLDDGDKVVREDAADALGILGDRRAQPLLFEAAWSGRLGPGRAAWALYQLGDRGMKVLPPQPGYTGRDSWRSLSHYVDGHLAQPSAITINNVQFTLQGLFADRLGRHPGWNRYRSIRAVEIEEGVPADDRLLMTGQVVWTINGRTMIREPFSGWACGAQDDRAPYRFLLTIAESRLGAVELTSE